MAIDSNNEELFRQTKDLAIHSTVEDSGDSIILSGTVGLPERVLGLGSCLKWIAKYHHSEEQTNYLRCADTHVILLSFSSSENPIQ